MAKHVALYLEPGCADCHQAEEFLQRRGIPYTSKDIQADPAALSELVNRWKSLATPTLVIDGEVIIGFSQNRERIEELLDRRREKENAA
jgi:glutaredoxin